LERIHHVAVDRQAAARLALAAGVDSELPDGTAFRTLADQVRQGKVAQADVDRACARILKLKFRAGLFEQPFADAQAAARLTGNAEARALALEAARKSVCLLTNNGALPLAAGKRIAVIGPNAAVARLGGYSSEPRRTVSLLEGMRAVAGAGTTILHAQGVFITNAENRSDDAVVLADPVRNRALIAEAVALAQTADIVVLAIGDTEQTSREGFAANHLGDRTELDLVGDQNALFDALKATGKPVVVAAINGRPPSWPDVVARADALLECWYGGQEGGTAMAEALFGRINPGAKLPVTVVREVGQVPLYYNAKPSVGRGYLFAETAPLFPFGHGLSYTKFEIGAPVLSAPRIGNAGSVTVSVEVANVGPRAGDEVVQVYVHDQVASVARPVRELKGFERVTLAPGERRTVKFVLGPEAFRFFDIDMREVVEPGLFDIAVGNSSVALKTATLEIA
jgi:beta-glucosidase